MVISLETVIKRVKLEDIKIESPIRKNDGITSSFIKSLKSHGNVYPLIVTKDNTLIDGKRRLLGLKSRAVKSTHVIVAEGDKDELELVLNIQRKDLDPLEKAEAFKRFIDKRKISQRKAAKLLGISKSVIEYHIKMLGLPEEAKEELRYGKVKPYSKIIEKQYRKRLETPEQFRKAKDVTQFQSLVNRLVSFRDYLKGSSLQITEYARLKEIVNDIILILDMKIASPPTAGGQIKQEELGNVLKMHVMKRKYEKRRKVFQHVGEKDAAAP